MLLELNVTNIALISRLRIEFERGLNVLTGETGAGKSIVVDCVNLALGGRADRDLIRTGEERASVRALFDISSVPAAADFLADLGIEAPDGYAEVSREITRGGKNICRVNGCMVLLSQLKAFTGMLVDVHGQHEHQALMDPDKHLSFLDGFAAAEIAPLKAEVYEKYREYSEIRSKLNEVSMNEAERARKLDALKFQYEEISKAKLKRGEEDELSSKARLYENAERISDRVRTAYERVYSGGKSPSAQENVKRAMDCVKAIADIDEKFAALAARLEEIYYSVSDVGYELQAALEEITFDPGEAERVADRLDLIKRLERKYGPELEDVLKFAENAGAEIAVLESSEERKTELASLAKAALDKLNASCERLTAARKQSADRLCEAVVAQLADLGMGKTRFGARFERRQNAQADGCDEVEFIISPNPGEPMKPLAAIASGGELSRLMLAIKAIAAENDGVDTMIFDEIDTGVSGRMAQTVGEKMCMLGKNRQVICVTHLAQIAALGDASYMVEKTTDGEITRSGVVKLDEEGRVRELARLVGGADGSESGLTHARNMLQAAAALKKKRFE